MRRPLHNHTIGAVPLLVFLAIGNTFAIKSDPIYARSQCNINVPCFRALFAGVLSLGFGIEVLGTVSCWEKVRLLYPSNNQQFS